LTNELTYILPWESLADRETMWTAFQNDAAKLKKSGSITEDEFKRLRARLVE